MILGESTHPPLASFPQMHMKQNELTEALLLSAGMPSGRPNQPAPAQACNPNPTPIVRGPITPPGFTHMAVAAAHPNPFPQTGLDSYLHSLFGGMESSLV